MKCSRETSPKTTNQITGTEQTNKQTPHRYHDPPPRGNDSSFSNQKGREARGEPQRGRVTVKKLVGSISTRGTDEAGRSTKQRSIKETKTERVEERKNGVEKGEEEERKEGRKVRRGHPLVGSAARPVQLTIKGESKSPDLRGWGERGQGKKGVTNRPISRDDEVLRLIRSFLKVPLRFHSRHTSACSRRLPESSQVFRTITLKNHSLD